jgi:hypothetical protein
MTSFKGIPPRKITRLRDNAARLPSVARTTSTSDRSGKHIVEPFDDTHVIIFREGDKTYDTMTPIGLPQSMVQAGHVASFVDLAAATSSFEYTDSRTGIYAGISDAFLETPTSEVVFTPYSEHVHYEQGNTSSFYMTGSVVDGFTGRLSDKTILRLSLPHVSQYVFLSTTASLAYYSFSSSSFERVGTVTNPSDSYAYRGSDEGVAGVLGGAVSANVGAVNYAHDARLFGPFGNMIASGTYSGTGNVTYNCVSNLLGQQTSTYMVEALRQYHDESVTVNSRFAASTSCVIPITGVLNHPFLIEKIIVELPLSASIDWLSDTTTLNYCDTFGQDVGGPCITVALLNQFAPTHRDVIASGTIVPVGDNISQLYNSAGSAYDHNAPHGFAAFTRPTVVVSGSQGGFTGNIIIEMTPATSNGAFSTSFRTSSFETTVSSFPDSRLRMLNKFGRAMSSFGSGRSIFGGDHDVNAARLDPPVNSVSGNRVDAFLLNNSHNAPYIIQSTDRLILSISKHRSVCRNPSTTTLGGDRTTLSASHTVAVDIGNIHLTLYGSLVTDRHQLHMCRNEPLTTLAACEALGSDHIVVDSYDVAPLTAFSGTYVDLYISGTFTGTLPDAAAVGTGFRRVMGSSVAATTSQPLRKFVQLGSREVVFDSFVPSATEIQTIDGADIVAFRQSSTSSISVLMFPLRSDNGVDLITSAMSGDVIRENTQWPFAFPFESRYGSIKRVRFANRTTTSTAMYTFGNGSADIFTSGSARIGRADAIVRVKSNQHMPNRPVVGYGTSSLEHLQDSNPSAGAGTYFGRELDEGVFNKGFYGFGDNTNNQPRYIEVERTYQPAAGPLTGAYRHEFHTNAAIRGWKYGIYDGSQRVTQMIVSRHHHGYVRDVMEQRQFTKLTVGGVVPREAPVTCRLVVTASMSHSGSNISAELTSSTPYFDGSVRN